MLFNSLEFICLFLPITILGFFGLGRFGFRQAAIVWLVFTSFIFYGYWNANYVILIVCSMIFNYVIGNFIAKQYQFNHEQSKFNNNHFLFIGISVNVALLAYFKYANFFVKNLNLLAGTELTLGTIILPLGISFFTFQQIGYLVDSHKGKTIEYNFLDYCLFVIFFPQLIAGPIVHHEEVLPQFANKNITNFNFANIAIGLTIFSLGLFKKVILADGVSTYATPIFNASASGTLISSFEAWCGVLAYTFQLYFDFSGYSDMAIGIARIFGIILPENFDSPYKANSIIDFWRRWHITLSRFLKDYLYIPLGGNRKGEVRRYGNLMITMLLGGLWHGASWMFVIWGGLHGFYLIVNHLYAAIKKTLHLQSRDKSIWEIACYRIITFLSIMVAWIFFRAESLSAAVSILKSMLSFDLHNLTPNNLWGSPANINLIFCVLWLVLSSIIVWFAPNTQQILWRYKPTLSTKNNEIKNIFLWKPNLLWAISLGLIFFIAISKILEAKPSEFLYFQF
ncbi:MBOAT family protein [Nostocaceae cyanobacterium CENA357]|uniref:MBOAT family protein n=1 Tax=Atlanticothrix silvestris CENA357 TaxID=1725252 RepID=A0A8J7HFN5_9CYAN|nr:MBOAT family O-acyltransferase [Atlanticothrix silvestris]MBH8552049.1 MBOAT family protein [Atlanticothrix silvestris CENA357]